MNAPLVHHITLTVTDTALSAEWYQRLLGPATTVLRQGPTWERIRMQWPSGLVIGVTRHESNDGAPFDCARVGLDHVGLACESADEVRHWFARLEDQGIDHGPFEEVSYGWAVTARDPDGIAIEFFCAAIA
jgi:catechol 2,3-dioxygenase-like lactoylglutathione lyase family enzyme